MTDQVEIRGTADMTPALLATLFWNMDSSEQADFFAALERIAGVKLCMQMAHVVDDIMKRADHGERDAQNGFQTMLSHAQEYVTTGIERRHYRARHAIELLSGKGEV